MIQKTVREWAAEKLGMEKIVLKGGVFLGYFVNDPQSAFYQSAQFRHIIQFLSENPQFGSFKEKKVRGSEFPSLLLRIEKVRSVKGALNALQELIAAPVSK